MQSGGEDECPSLGHLAGHGRERERGVLMWKCVEVCGVWNFGKDWNFGKLENLVVVEEGRCNTPFPEYVLSCVFRFFDRIFRFVSCIYFCIMNSLYDCFILDLDSWSWSQP